MAQDPTSPGSAAMTPQAIYQKERANCDAGRTAEDRATCLKEAGAALEERKRHQLDNRARRSANATDRCNAAAEQGQGRLPGAHRRAAELAPDGDHHRQRCRRRRDQGNDDHDAWAGDRDHAGPEAGRRHPLPATDPCRSRREPRSGRRDHGLLSSSPAPFLRRAPWPPCTSPTSNPPSTGGARRRPRPTASPPAPRCWRWPRSMR